MSARGCLISNCPKGRPKIFAIFSTTAFVGSVPKHAKTYRDGLLSAVSEIADHPKIYVLMGNGKTRRAVFKASAIYHEERPKSILIVRVLGQQDASRVYI